jgi:hypothetical protein
MPPPPTLTTTLSLSPPIFSPNDQVTLTLTTTSHATSPITVFTHPTILNPSLAQKRKNFTCTDLTINKPINLEITKGPKRSAFSRSLGSSDEQYFHTLLPGEPVKFSAPFKVANREGVVPGRRYRLGVSAEEQVAWWREGTKEEVLAPAGEEAGLEQDDDYGPIDLSGVETVEFEVREADAA